MAVVKLTNSKKGVLFIDDAGNVFITSVSYLQSILLGTAKSQIHMLRRLPIPADPKKFKPSELWDPNGVFTKQAELVKDKVGNNAYDGLGSSRKKLSEEVKAFEDKNVW